MTKEIDTAYPDFLLPANYEFVSYQKGMEKVWSFLQWKTGQMESLAAAEQRFENEFLPSIKLAECNCWFVRDCLTNEIIGTASLWRGDLFGTELDRVHWVAVHPAHNGRGIGKALLSKILKQAITEKIYLTTQTWSYPAIAMYRKFGFEAYLGREPVNWKSGDYSAAKQAGWEIIDAKLADKGV